MNTSLPVDHPTYEIVDLSFTVVGALSGGDDLLQASSVFDPAIDEFLLAQKLGVLLRQKEYDVGAGYAGSMAQRALKLSKP